MKTLVELLHDEMVRSGHFGDDEALAGIVGVVRKWLSQQRTLDTANRDVTGTFDGLIFEAGLGLDV